MTKDNTVFSNDKQLAVRAMQTLINTPLWIEGYSKPMFTIEEISQVFEGFALQFKDIVSAVTALHSAEDLAQGRIGFRVEFADGQKDIIDRIVHSATIRQAATSAPQSSRTAPEMEATF